MENADLIGSYQPEGVSLRLRRQPEANAFRLIRLNHPHKTPNGIQMATSDDSTTIAELKAIVQQFVDERNWRKFHNAKNLSMSLAIEAAELMEHFQWLTTDEVVAGEQQDFSEIADELADVTSYALALANVLKIDLSQALTSKMVKNRLKYPAT